MSKYREGDLERFNAEVPIGTAVRYWPVLPYQIGDPAPRDTRTRSQAWALGHGAVVVLVEGQSGGVLISHVELTPVTP